MKGFASVNEVKKNPRLYLAMDLQFFADGPGGEKTEDATTKKLTDARKEGQVARSQELITAVALFSLFLILRLFAGTMGNSFIKSFIKFFNLIEVVAGKNEEISLRLVSELMSEALRDIVIIMLPVMLTTVTVAIVTNVFQVRWQLTLKPLQPKLSKFSPIKGLKKIFSTDRLVELIKSLLKILVIGLLSYSTLRNQVIGLFRMSDGGVEAGIVLIGSIIINLGLRISAVFLIIGIGDYIYQRIKFRNQMKMTKQEVKDEYKQTEGDPQIKARIKQKMREAARRRMMKKLPEADVVITNPTHFACAIKYEKEVSSAPILIAKGADYIAQKIKEVAKENDIPIVENKPLARMLYYNVELDEEIPKELYQMTAEVLAYVYKLKNTA